MLVYEYVIFEEHAFALNHHAGRVDIVIVALGMLILVGSSLALL